MATENTAYKFPDEKEPEEKLEVSVEGDDVEIVDDTPAEDRGRSKMKEPPADVTDEELAQYSEGVRQRIQHFSKGYHEERRAKEAATREKEEAIRLAQTVLEENSKLKSSVGQNQAALLEQAKKTVAAEVEKAQRALKEAHDNFDTDAIVSAQDALMAAKIRSERVNSFRPAQAQQNAGQHAAPGVQPAARTEAPAPAPDPKVTAWQDANPWFGEDRKLTAYALAIHQELVENGYDTHSDSYYDKINAEMRSAFPKAFSSGKSDKSNGSQRSAVAPASRSTAPRKIVLTQSQVNLAKRLNVPLAEYAKQVAAEARKANA